MSDKAKKILDTFGKAISELSEMEKEKLLAFGEGMAFLADKRKEDKSNDKRPASV